MPLTDPLPYAVLACRGPDARRFLNGQLSQDVLGLRPDRVELAGWHTPQGRTLALVRLIAAGPEDVLLLVSRELAADLESGLRRYVLRAKVTIRDESDRWTVRGRHDPSRPNGALGEAAREGDGIVWRHTTDGRSLVLSPIDASRPTDVPTALPIDWQRADILAGVPELHLATRGEFVAQMLNLDVLGALSFTKGCYTGQEVIARAHYRGRVKRRLQGFATSASTPLVPGDTVTLGDGRRAQILNSAPNESGGRLFLAVAPWPPAPDTASDSPERRVEAVALPLPYSLPE